MSSNVLQPNPPHQPALSSIKLTTTTTTTSPMFARNALLQPPKKSHLLHHCLSIYFSPRVMWALLGFFLLSWSEFHRENRKARNFSSLTSPLFLLYFSSLPCPCCFLSSSSFYYFLSPSPFRHPSSSVSHPFSFSLSLSLSPFISWSLASVIDLMKKMKGVVAAEPSSYALYQDSRARFKHQSLMQDFEELQKDAEVMKNRLEMMKQKKSVLTAEVRFLRRRYKYLIGKQSMNLKPKQDLVQTQNLKVQRTNVSKRKNHSKKETALRYPAPAMDLNHKARTVRWKETTLHNSNPVIDLNQKEMILSGKESTKRKNTPVFDLNQVSLEEEEEIQANCEPLRTDEPNKSILRGGIDEQHSDMKLLVCRTIGNGSNRTGKRKITWQDQVALRV